jgi:hypothetical protein
MKRAPASAGAPGFAMRINDDDRPNSPADPLSGYKKINTDTTWYLLSIISLAFLPTAHSNTQTAHPCRQVADICLVLVHKYKHCRTVSSY